MIAALRFARELQEKHPANSVAKLRVELYGSLALTGIGHRNEAANG